MFDEVVKLCFRDVSGVGKLFEFVLCHTGLCVCLCEMSEVDLFVVGGEVWSECVEEVGQCLGAVGVELHGWGLSGEVVCCCVEGGSLRWVKRWVGWCIVC